MELNQRMQHYRKEREMTQAEMAKACGLSTNYVSALERGVYQPNAETLITWAKACGVSIDELVGNVEPSKIIPELRKILEVLSPDVQRKICKIIKIALE